MKQRRIIVENPFFIKVFELKHNNVSLELSEKYVFTAVGSSIVRISIETGEMKESVARCSLPLQISRCRHGVYVADPVHKCIYEFSDDLALRTIIRDRRNNLLSPCGVAHDCLNDALYVLDQNQLKMYDPVKKQFFRVASVQIGEAVQLFVTAVPTTEIANPNNTQSHRLPEEAPEWIDRIPEHARADQ